MVFLAIGIPLLIVTVILGIALLSDMNCSACSNEIIQLHKYAMFINFGAWILAIILVIKGLKKRRESKQHEQINQEKIRYNSKKQQDEEIKNLKEKIEVLEKDKEKKD